MRIPLNINHTDWKSSCPHQGNERDAHQEAVEHTQGSRERVRTGRGCDVGSVDTKHCRPTDTSTAAVVCDDEKGKLT